MQDCCGFDFDMYHGLSANEKKSERIMSGVNLSGLVPLRIHNPELMTTDEMVLTDTGAIPIEVLAKETGCIFCFAFLPFRTFCVYDILYDDCDSFC